MKSPLDCPSAAAPSTRGQVTTCSRDGVHATAPSYPPCPTLTARFLPQTSYPRPLSPGNFPEHPRAWVSCLGERVNANIRDALGLATPQCAGVSNPCTSSLQNPSPLASCLLAAMSVLPRLAYSLPGPSGSLCTMLALVLLLTPPEPLASGECSQPGMHGRSAAPLQQRLQHWDRKEVSGAKLAGVVFPAICPHNRVSLSSPSWSFLGHSERAALCVFSCHPQDSPQNDQSPGGGRRRPRVPQCGNYVSLSALWCPL